MAKDDILFCKQSNCAGCRNGKCFILTDARFKGLCPFFKTREQAERDRRKAELDFFKKHGYYYTPEAKESESQKAILTKRKPYRSIKNGNRAFLLETKDR